MPSYTFHLCLALLAALVASGCGEPTPEVQARAQACVELQTEAMDCAVYKDLDEMTRDAADNIWRRRDAAAVRVEWEKGTRECKKRNVGGWSRERYAELDACKGLLSRLQAGLSF